jgi:hypothetical protein
MPASNDVRVRRLTMGPARVNYVSSKWRHKFQPIATFEIGTLKLNMSN